LHRSLTSIGEDRIRGHHQLLGGADRQRRVIINRGLDAPDGDGKMSVPTALGEGPQIEKRRRAYRGHDAIGLGGVAVVLEETDTSAYAIAELCRSTGGTPSIRAALGSPAQGS
jgi:hypothetical protein